MRLRILSSIILMIGFYVLAIGIAAGLLAVRRLIMLDPAELF